MTTQATPEVKSVADAIDAGIAAANAGGAPPLPPADDDAGDGGTSDDTTQDNSSADDSGADPASAGDAGGDQSGATGDDAGSDADGAAAADDAASGDGTGGDDAAGADATGKVAAPKAGTPDGKQGKPDPLTAPIPNALKPETKERIRTLVDRTKTAEAALAERTTERDELITAITETGASPEQYAATLDYLALVNSKDQNKLRQAANFMMRELAALSRVGGFRIPGITTIAGHADLEQAVADGKITQELAEELAAKRAGDAHAGKIGAAQAQASEARQRYEQAETKARADMNAIEDGYVKNDPLYKEKKPMIVGLLNEMIAGDRKAGIPPLHPSKWAAAYQRIYNTLPKTLGGMKPVPRPGARVPQNQPLRTQQPAGAQKQEPKSVAEAIDMGIDMARGG